MPYALTRTSTAGREYCERSEGRLSMYTALSNARTVSFQTVVGYSDAPTKSVSDCGRFLHLCVPLAEDSTLGYLLKDDCEDVPAPVSEFEAGIIAWMLDHGAHKDRIKGSGLLQPHRKPINNDGEGDEYIVLYLDVVVPVREAAPVDAHSS